MKTEDEIRSEIEKMVGAYRANAPDLTAKQVAAHNQKVRGLQDNLSKLLSKGAKPCECGNERFAPMGMLKTPFYIDRGVEMPAVYEVGCVHCAPELVERADGYEVEFSDGTKGKFKRRSFSARGLSVKDAVANWNSGKWVEDNWFTRNMPGISETATQDANGVWHLRG